jgi:hypothetical protein
MDNNIKKWHVVDDDNVNYYDCFVVDDDWESSYSGYRYIAEFSSKDEAQAYADKLNSYEGQPDVVCNCCSQGCTMSAYDYAHWNGKCAYAGYEEE